MEEVGKVQEKALINSKIYLNQFSKSKYDFSKNNIFYLSSFANCIGLMKIKNFLQIEENPIKKTYIILKNMSGKNLINQIKLVLRMHTDQIKKIMILKKNINRGKNN